MTDLVTRQPVVKKMHNKGRQSRSVVTVLGVVKVVRRWCHATGHGSVVTVDEFIDPGQCESWCVGNGLLSK